MAVLAFQTEETRVNFGLIVASDAFHWRTSEYFSTVAGLALNLCMPALQSKPGIMIEITQPVNAIMTIQTGPSEQSGMLIHKSRGFRGMACQTYIGAYLISSLRMAIQAGKYIPRVINMVMCQAKGSHTRMLK
jgi:hypothetical protein